MGQDDVEQLGCECCPQLFEGAAVVLDEPVVGGGVEGLQAGGAGPLLQGGPGLGHGRGIGGVSGLPDLGEHFPGPAVGRAIRCRLVQAAAVGLELGADPCQLGAQYSRGGATGRLTGADVGTGTVSGLSSPQGQGAAQGPADLGRLHAVVVQVEQQVPDAGLLAQAAGDDVEGGLLLGDEHDGPPRGQRPEDEVGDGLGLARSGRPLDDEAAPGDGVGHDPGLSGVRGQGQVLGRLVDVEAPIGRADRVHEVLAPSRHEVGDERVGGDRRPVVLEVLPHAVGGEAEQSQVDRGGDDVVPAGAPQAVAHAVESGPQVDAVLVESRSPQLGQLDAGVPREAVEEGVVGRGGARLVQDEPEVIPGALEVDRDEDEWGVQAAAVALPRQGPDGQVEVVGAGLLDAGAGAGGQGLEALHALGGRQLDLDGSFLQERDRAGLLLLKALVGQLRGSVSSRGEGDVFLVIDKVLELADERRWDAQLHRVAGGAIDEGIAQGEVEQALLPVPDLFGGPGNGEVVRVHGDHGRFMGGVGMCVDPLTRISWADPSAPRTAGLSMGTPMTAGGRPMRAGDADCSGRRAQITTALRHDRTPLVPGAAVPARSWGRSRVRTLYPSNAPHKVRTRRDTGPRHRAGLFTGGRCERGRGAERHVRPRRGGAGP